MRSPVDLRLVAVAGGVWGAALVAVGGSASGAVALAAAGCALAVLALVTADRGSVRLRAVGHVVAAVAVGVTAGAISTALAVSTRDGGPLHALAAQRAAVTLELVVADDPRLASGGGFVVPAEAAELTHGGERVRGGGRVLVLAQGLGWRGLLPGQRVQAEGRLAPPLGGDLTAAVLRARGAPRPLGEPPWHQRAAGVLRAGLQHAVRDLPAAEGGLLPGLSVGDTSRMDPALTEAFKKVGLTHLTAVSGSNLALLGGFIVLLARRARAGPRLTAVLAGAGMVAFVILARPSPSVLRAAVMGGVALLALALRRPRAAVPGLAAAVLLLVLADPALARSPGFALSVLATAALLLIAPGWRDALRSRGVPGGLAEALAVPAAAQAACAPVIAAMSGTVSLTAIPANLLAVPAVAPATVTGVLAAAVSPLSPRLAEWLAWLGSWPARWLVEIAHIGARLPGGALPWADGVSGGLLLAAVITVMAVLGRSRAVRVVLAATVAATVLVALPVRVLAPGWPPSGWAMVACDVGQGDALVLRAGPGTAVVVDAGPDPAAVDGCLSRLGVTDVALLVVSHLHADHVGGLSGVRSGRTVHAIAVSPDPEPAAGRQLLLREAAASGVAVTTPEAGRSFVVGEVRLTVLSPSRPFAGTRSDPNNNSLVLLAELAGLRVLLAGDAENDAQRALVSAGAVPHVDVLKVAHHGSAYSEGAFLDAADPAVALVSVGAGNRYGHPNVGVLAHLRSGGARVLRTDQDGDLAVLVHEGVLAVAVRGRDDTARAS